MTTTASLPNVPGRVMTDGAMTDHDRSVMPPGPRAASLGVLVAVHLAVIPLADVANGWFASREGGLPVALAWKLLVIPLLVLILLERRTPRFAFVAVSALFLALLLQIGVPGAFLPGRLNTTDLTVLARGPFLFGLEWLLLLSLSSAHLERAAKAYFLSTWITVTVSIVVLSILGISLATYEGSDESTGQKGVYVAGNELTITYMLSWWYLTRRQVGTLLSSMALTATTLVLLTQIGTKSGFVVFAIVMLWRMLLGFGLGPKAALAVFIAGAALTVTFAVDLFLWVGPALVGWERLEFFIERYDPLTALTGGRFLFIAEILAIFSNFGVAQVVFGMGFGAFWSAIGRDSVESDIIDLFGGGGLVGVGWFYGLFLVALGVTLRRRTALSPAGGAVLAIGLYSVFVGHVAFAATPIVSTAVVLAVLADGWRRERNR